MLTVRSWLFATAYRRFIFTLFVAWLLGMGVAVAVYIVSGGRDPMGFILFTALILAVWFLSYFIPRVSNWVEYRKWDNRLDHYKDSATDGGSTEGEK